MVADAVHYNIMDAAQDVIQALSLTDIGTNVVLRKLPTDRDLTLPAVIVSHGTETETQLPGTNLADDWGYPVLVSIVSNGNQDYTLSEQELEWREKVRNAFNNKRLSAVGTTFRCVVEPRAIVDLGLWKEQNLNVSTLLVRVYSREVRS